MIFSRDLLHESSARGDAARIVVVGSGPPGAIATVLLSSVGLDVTLLDAGLPREAWGFTARVGGMTLLRLHRKLGMRSDGVTVAGDPGTILYEDVAPGGLTNHWSCAVPRFSHSDFLDGARAGEQWTWPIDYDDLLPWYEWVEPFLRISGSPLDAPLLPAGIVRHARSLGATWRPVIEAAARVGQSVLPVPYAYGGGSTVTFSGTVFNSFVRLVKKTRGSGRVAIHHGARVTALEWSGAKRRVDAVVARDVRTGATYRVPCKAVILAAGAINTTRILLQSLSTDFPAGLGNTDGVLGRYLHDHPLGKMDVALAQPLAVSPAAYVTRSPLDRTVPLYAAACLQWSGSGLLVRSVLRGNPGRLPTVGFNVFGTMAPSPDNFVALNDAAPSADGTPGLTLKIHHPPEAARTLIAARDQLLELLAAAKLGPHIRLWQVDPVGSAVHFAGTCRMHASPRFGMLDRWNRVHGVPNVVVADSAAFTTGPEKNPVLTAMALSARAASRLADDLRAGNL